MIRFKRRNTIWLMTLGAVIGLALLSGVADPAVQLALLTLFGGATFASTVELGNNRETILDALRRAPIRQRVSPQAKEAVESARSRGGYVNQEMMLLDVGLIASQTSYDGMAMRRTRSISKDDDGVRPFVTFHVDSVEADRPAVVRFEVYNQYGEQQYIHEMRSFLRTGEVNIMADHHLPLAGNADIEGTGDWDLRVFVDGNLVALHTFMLAPSMNERAQRLRGQSGRVVDNDALYDIIDEEPQELTPKLQDLLKQQSARPRASEDNPRTTRRRRS